jgi:hypothetical protein
MKRILFVRIPIFNVKIYVPFRNKMSAFCSFQGQTNRHKCCSSLLEPNSLITEKEILQCQTMEA